MTLNLRLVHLVKYSSCKSISIQQHGWLLPRYKGPRLDKTTMSSSSLSLSSMVRGFSAPLPAVRSWLLLAYDRVVFNRDANDICCIIGIKGGILLVYTRNKLERGLSSSSELSPPPRAIVIDRNERVWPRGALKSKLPKPGKNSRVRFDGALWVDAKLAAKFEEDKVRWCN